MDLRLIHDHFRELAENSRTGKVIVGVDQDDCAVIQTDSPTIVITSDFINSRPAIVELGIGSWHELGCLAVCHNLADLAGSAAAPLAYVSGICVPRTVTEEDLWSFTSGVTEACKMHSCPLVGGDTKFGESRSIFGTAVGIPMSSVGVFTRSQAEADQIIVSSRPLGTFAAAVVAVSIGSPKMSMLLIREAKRILATFYVDTSVVTSLAATGAPCAGTDISDGLGRDLIDLCRSSGCGAELVPESIPVDDFTLMVSDALGVAPWAFSFASGGDFASIYSVPAELAAVATESGGAVIGRTVRDPASVTAGRLNLVRDQFGHSADRYVCFSDEILNCVEGISRNDGYRDR